MLKPLNPVRGGDYCLRMVNRREIVKSFLESSWESAEGKQVQIITNFLPEPQHVTVGGREVRLEALNAVVLAPDLNSILPGERPGRL